MTAERRATLMTSLEELRPGSASATHFEAIASGLEELGRRIHRLSSQPNGGSRSFSILRSQWNFFAAGMRHEQIYARWHVLDLSTVLLSLLGRKVVLEVNGTTEDILLAHPRLRSISWIIRALAALQFRLASGVIAVSPGLASWVTTISGNRSVKVAPNGGNIRLAQHRATAASPPYAIFVGELASWQGIETLLAARCSEEWPKGLGLVVVGDGALATEVQRLAARKLLTYEGRVSHESAINSLARASVSLSPQAMSVQRNWVMGRPLKISESLILGVPCVATAFPDSSQLLARFPGSCVIDGDDGDELARAVARAATASADDRSTTAKLAQELCSWGDAVHAADQMLSVRPGDQ